MIETTASRLGVTASGLVLALALFALLPQFGSDYLIGIGLTLFMWIALTESWVVLSGMTGYISLGHAVFFGIGSYIAVLGWGVIPLWLSILLGGAGAGLVALIMGYPVLRVRGPYFVILTFGIAEFVKFCVVNVEAGLGKAGRLLFGAPSLETLYYIMIILAGLAIALTYWVRRSRFGTGLRAIRENEEAAETLGVPVARYKIAAFALSAVIPGMVGAVMVLRVTYFEPLQAFNPVVSFTIISMAIIGGSDDAPGPLLGAISLVVVSELLWSSFPQVYMIVLGVLLIGFVLWAPDGLYGRLTSLFRRRVS
jgi:branched-chain amino acid transport system permease protein